MRHITIYTDGACSGNPGIGGWAAIIICNGDDRSVIAVKEISGADEYTTNNRMELTAAIKALEYLPEPCVVTLFTDSAYLCRAFTDGWIFTWLRNGWQTSQGKGVLNRDLWERLLELTKIHNVSWYKVKGHANSTYNNRCDELAKDEIVEANLIKYKWDEQSDAWEPKNKQQQN